MLVCLMVENREYLIAPRYHAISEMASLRQTRRIRRTVVLLGLAGHSSDACRRRSMQSSIPVGAQTALTLQRLVAAKVTQTLQHVVQIGMNAIAVEIVVVVVASVAIKLADAKLFALMIVIEVSARLLRHRWISKDIALVGTVRSAARLTRRRTVRRPMVVSTASAAAATAVANHNRLLFHQIVLDGQRSQQAIEGRLTAGHLVVMVVLFGIVGRFAL